MGILQYIHPQIGEQVRHCIDFPQGVFYGLVTILPTFIYNPPHPAVLLSSGTAVWFSLLFLAVMASLVCFVLWNLVVKHIGVVKSSNYLYLNPVITCITSAIVLGEK